MLSLDSTLGVAYIGVVLAAMLHGVTCLQALYYFLHQTDGWRVKGTVLAVLVLDTVHQVLITHTVYVYLVTNFARPSILDTTVWSLLAEVLFNGFTALLVQGFLTLRVWHLSSQNLWFTSVVSLFVVSEFTCVCVFSIYALLHVHTFEQLEDLKARCITLSIVVNALAAGGDIMLTSTLVYLLQRSRTGFAQSERMINTLIMFSINTGLLTTLCAVASLISILAWGHTFIYIMFFFCIGRLYSNSLLATLNARRSIRASGNGVNTFPEPNCDFAFPLNGHSTLSENRNGRKTMSRRLGLSEASSSDRFQHRVPNISIQVDTVHEYIADHGESSSTVESRKSPNTVTRRSSLDYPV